MKPLTNRKSILLTFNTKKPILIIMVLAVLVMPAFTTSNYYLTLGSLIMCYGILAMSVDIMSGYMGLSAFGHAGFFGFSAYCVAFLTVKAHFSPIYAILIALVLTVLLAALFGFIGNKVWGNTYLIVNLALGQTIWGLTYRWTQVTGGEMGIPGVQRPNFFGIDFGKNINYYYFMGAIFVIVIFFLYRFVNSPFGMTIHGLRQSRQRMSALGFNIYKHKYITYIISATAAGIGGIMYVFFTGFISPNETTIMTAAKAVLMALVGGIGTLAGGIIGAAVVVLIENLLSSVTERWMLVLGSLYIITVMVSPKGIIGSFKSLKEKLGTRKSKKNKEVTDVADVSADASDIANKI
jgi:branched-chain amino acid transport system permease protein